MRRLIHVALWAIVITPLVSAADVSGKWSGSLEIKTPDGQAMSFPAFADFKQQGTSLSGNVWKDAEDKFVIKKGKVTGDRITFEFTAPEGSEDSALVHTVRLTVASEAQLQGEMEFEHEGTKATAKLTFTRDK